MAKAFWAVLLLCAAPVFAQTPDGGTPAPATPAEATPPSQAEVRREVESQVEQAKKELREELRAQLATQSASEGWTQEWTEEKRKLELFVPKGYLRLRPEMFHKLRLGWTQPDPSGYFPFPAYHDENTVAGANMRFRFEPTLNVSEEVRIQAQIDALDNLVLGSSAAYQDAYVPVDALSESQTAPRSAINSTLDSIQVKRVWGEVSTPVGILRFGRMGSQWGLGLLHNDGNCLDCDFGDTVDRLMFVSEPIPGYFIAPAIDFNVEGPATRRSDGVGQPVDLFNQDDAHSLVLVLARRDTPQQIKSKLESNLSVFNYGVHFEYRTQQYDSFVTGSGTGNDLGDAGRTQNPGVTTVTRNAKIYQPDVWARFERRHMRVELEVAGTFGSFEVQDAVPGNTDVIRLIQFGGALQGEYRFLNDRLKVGGELGFATGDNSPGFGEYAARTPVGGYPPGTVVGTQPGSLDGPQYSCQTAGGCADDLIRNFRFNRDYRVDEILFREIIGGVTDAVYLKPSLRYSVADGFDVFVSAIYSRAAYAESTPSGTDSALGLEFDAGARYQTEDGFFAGLTYAVLFPFDGLKPSNNTTQTSLDTPQALRGVLGIKF
jgi:uncharacterized protein (TIGR04551 family)